MTTHEHLWKIAQDRQKAFWDAIRAVELAVGLDLEMDGSDLSEYTLDEAKEHFGIEYETEEPHEDTPSLEDRGLHLGSYSS